MNISYPAIYSHPLFTLFIGAIAALVVWYLTNQRAKKHLKNIHERLDMALSASAIIVWEWDSDSESITYTRGSNNPLGYSFDEMPINHKGVLSLVHKDDCDRYHKNLKAMSSSESGHLNIQFRMLNNKNNYIWLRAQGKTLNRKGKKIHVGILEDINSLKTVELTLSQSQYNLESKKKFVETLLKNTGDYISLKNSDGSFINVSDSFEEISGFTPQELIGKTDAYFQPKHLADLFRENDLKALNSNSPLVVEEWANSHSRQEQRFFETLKTKVTNDDGSTLGLLSISRDVTEKHKLIERLTQSKKSAEDANNSKTMFLANMSHEIRTPMNAILGYSQLLIQDQTLMGEHRDRISHIYTAGNRLLNLINNILDLSKIESGNIQVNSELTEVNAELKEICNIMRVRAETKGLAFNQEITIPSTCIIKTDKNKLGQILINLISNAIKFTHKGEVTLSAYIKEETINFTIKDSGDGIEETDLEKLFSPFTQGSSGVSSGGGTGLGLALSKRFTEALGGTLTLSSELNVGTIATLQLPAKLSAAGLKTFDKNDLTPLALPPGKHYTAMIVEDDTYSQRLLSNLLSNAGFDILTCNDGLEGLECFKLHKIDIIFTDIRMPNMTGDMLLEQIKILEKGKGIPIIAVSASTLEQEQEFYHMAGFTNFISKPIQFSDVYAAISSALNIDFTTSKTSHKITPQYSPENDQTTHTEKTKNTTHNIVKACNNGDIDLALRHFNTLSESELDTGLHKKISTALSHYDLAIVESLLETST